MALEAVTLLTQLSALLLLGVVSSVVANKLRVSNVIILLAVGTLIGLSTDTFVFESNFLVGLAIFTLAIVVFEGTSKFSFRQIDKYSGPALQLTAWYLLFVSISVGVMSYYLFFSDVSGGWVLSFVLATALAGTDASSIVLLLKDAKGRFVKLLTVESIINTPLMVLLPFIVLTLKEETLSINQFADILTQIIVGVGAGVVIGIILFKALRRYYAKDLSNVAVIAGALITYLLAENLNGSGVLAVATLGVIFGNVTIKEKAKLNSFSFAFGSILEILVFLLIGIIVGGNMTYSHTLLFGSLLLYGLIAVSRFIATYFVVGEEFTLFQRLFLTFSMPRGIAVAVLIFVFSSRLYADQIPVVLVDVLFLVTIISILVATIAAWYWRVKDE